MTEKTIHTINASGKRLGRVASEAASLLMGKDRPDFVRNAHPDIEVRIEHASSLEIDERKRDSKVYRRYTGYMGGLREQTLAELVTRHGHAEVLRRAVYGMLPGNRLRARMMKNLTIAE